MSDESALLAAIRAAPEDDAPRLVYADWLDEHGQPERAEFIRVQVALARHDDPALRRREAEILAARHDAFAGPLAAPHLRFRFERGFVVWFGHTGVFFSDKLDLNQLLRFFPDGQVVYEPTRHSAESAVTSLCAGQRISRPIRGTYSIELLADSVRVQITFTDGTTSRHLGGYLDGTLLRFDSGIWAGHGFAHFHFPDLNSFPET